MMFESKNSVLINLCSQVCEAESQVQPGVSMLFLNVVISTAYVEITKWC